VCDVVDCGLVHDTTRGLSIHKSKRHCENNQAIDSTSVQCDNVSIISADSTSSSVRSE